MSRIDDLIAQHCPNGVEHKELGELGLMFGGLTGKSKADFGDGNARYVSYMNVFNNLSAEVMPPDLVRVGEAESQRELHLGDILLTGSSESVAECGMSSVVTVEPPEPLYLNSFCIGYRPTGPSPIDPEFAKYLFRSSPVRRQIVRTANGVTRFNVSKARLAKVRIPIPPIAVQREIVEILDRFTALEAELEAELEARQQQFEHYRKALTQEPGGSGAAVRLTLGDLFEMKAGKHVSASAISPSASADTPHPCYGGNGIRGFVAESSHDGDYLLVGRQGALCGNVKRVSGTLFATEHAVVLTAKGGVDIDWAFHKLTVMDLNRYATKSAQPGLAVGNVKKVALAVPDLNEQARIARILDLFGALTGDLSSGLPAEIAARRTQYEYYRDRLLTFEEAAA